MILCDYGCQQEARFKIKNDKNCCSEFYNSCPEIRKKNSESGKISYKQGNRINADRKNPFSVEQRRKSHESHRQKIKLKPFEFWGRRLKEELILKEQDGKCLHCKVVKEWNNKPLIFELDHIDGNNKNNIRENLRLLCPNCHSQTENWRGRNVNKGIKKVKVTDEEIIRKIIEVKNIRQCLISFGLASKGGNYQRIYKLIKLNNLEYLFEEKIKEKIKLKQDIEETRNKLKIQKIKNFLEVEKTKEEIFRKRKELTFSKSKTKKDSLRIFPIGHQLAEKNSQHGTMWICNLDLKENKKIKKEEEIPEGWLKGRKYF